MDEFDSSLKNLLLAQIVTAEGDDPVTALKAETFAGGLAFRSTPDRRR
jgi:hypothetical protein